MTDLVDQSTVYQHAVRPEWGGAVIAWERDGKRGYQFEDGQLRVFTLVHYHLFERIDASLDRVRTLRALLGLQTRAVEPNAPDLLGAPPPSLDEQIAHFRAAYPGGFTGERWRDDHRGGAGRTRKRQRDPAIARAQKELTAQQLASCLERRRPDEGLEALGKVLTATDLVGAGHVQHLLRLPPNRATAVLHGLYDLLYANSTVEIRLVQWIQALTRGSGKKPAWALATAPLALVAPREHVFINRAIFAAQAAALRVRQRLPVSPTGLDYVQLLAMAKGVREHLIDRGCPPADLFDVHDFMVATLSAGAQRIIAARR